MRRKKWNIGEEHNGWEIVSSEPHKTPNGSDRYRIKIKCPKCGFSRITSQSISKLPYNDSCAHYGSGIVKKPVIYDRKYKYSGDGLPLNNIVYSKLDNPTYKKLKDISAELGVSQSGVLRMALKEFLKIGGNNHYEKR